MSSVSVFWVWFLPGGREQILYQTVEMFLTVLDAQSL